MPIQWYPGHMAKATRLIEECSKLVSAVVYVIDSRVVMSSFNPKFESLTGRKPTLYLLNKSDLSDPRALSAWQARFKSENRLALTMCGFNASGVKNGIIDGLNSLLADRIARDGEKGIKTLIRAMIIGIPNCGKSTILNSLAGEKRAAAENRPGVTRGKQWLRLSDGIEFLDTPGTLWGSFSSEDTGYHLAYVGSIKDEVFDELDVACRLITELISLGYTDMLLARYKLDGDSVSGLAPHEILELIGRARGAIMRGGEVDLSRASTALLDDFRKGRLGRITLERA